MRSRLNHNLATNNSSSRTQIVVRKVRPFYTFSIICFYFQMQALKHDLESFIKKFFAKFLIQVHIDFRFELSAKKLSSLSLFLSSTFTKSHQTIICKLDRWIKINVRCLIRKLTYTEPVFAKSLPGLWNIYEMFKVYISEDKFIKW